MVVIEPWSFDQPAPMYPQRCLSLREQKRTGHLFAHCPEPMTPGDTKNSFAQPCGTCAAVEAVVRTECARWRAEQVAKVQSWRQAAPEAVLATTTQVDALVVLARHKRPRWFAIQGEPAVREEALSMTRDQAAARIVELSKEK